MTHSRLTGTMLWVAIMKGKIFICLKMDFTCPSVLFGVTELKVFQLNADKINGGNF